MLSHLWAPVVENEEIDALQRSDQTSEATFAAVATDGGGRVALRRVRLSTRMPATLTSSSLAAAFFENKTSL